MTQVLINPIETNTQLKNLSRTEITIINEKTTKIKFSPFFVLNPTTIKDLNLLCDYLTLLKDSGKSLKNLGGVSYRVFEHDSLVEDIKNKNQLDLNFKRQNDAFLAVEKYIFKFIEPSTSLYRDRFSNSIKNYMKLDKIPDYLSEHFKGLIDPKNKNIDLDVLHMRFWKSLFTIDPSTKRKKSLHFIKWHESLQKSRGADIFLPPVPYIKNTGGEFLVEKAIEINTDACDICEGDVATYFEFDIEIFRSREIIDRILSYISENPNKCKFVIFKIHNIDKILAKGFGLSALEHFELFLQTVKSIKENKKSVFGILNGAGFGYCLLGTVFDFFTDTINNYGQDPQRRKKGQIIIKGPRQFLNYFTLCPEKFTDIANYFKDHGSLPCHCAVCEDRYNKMDTFDARYIDWDEWSNDCKKHALQVWEMVAQEMINAMVKGDENLFFERVRRSDYVKLSHVIKRISF